MLGTQRIAETVAIQSDHGACIGAIASELSPQSGELIDVIRRCRQSHDGNALAQSKYARVIAAGDDHPAFARQHQFTGLDEAVIDAAF